MKIKLLLTYFCLFAFCLRFSYLIENHEHRSENEICIQEHSHHLHHHSACEIADVLGWENENSCDDKAHIKSEKHHCTSCGFDFTKYFESYISQDMPSDIVNWCAFALRREGMYHGFTIFLCNKGPPARMS